MLRKFVVILAAATLLVLGGCSKPPTDAEQTDAKAELVARGFVNPKYSDEHSGKSLYNVDFGSCRIVIGIEGGSYAWLVEPGNNRYWDYWVTGDDRLNADWLREHPTGTAYTNTNSPRSYDLQPCLEKK